MSRPEYDDLLQGEIDDANSVSESARLKELLASRPDLDARLGSLRRVSETLGRAERLDPPPGFVDGVMLAVRRQRPDREARPGWREALRSLFAPAPLAACACTLLVGVVLGTLLPSDSRLFSRSEVKALSGTALTHGRLGAPGILDRRTFAREGVTGEAVTRIEEGLLVLDIDLDATRPFDVSLDLDGTGLSPRSFTLDGPPVGNVVLEMDQVRFSLPAGRRRCSVSFGIGDPGGRPLRLRVGDGEGWDLSRGQKGPG